MVRAALAQFSGHWDKAANLRKAEALARQAAAAGARIICFPELCTTIYFCFENNPEHFRFAEPVPGPAVNRMQQVARETASVLVFPLYENDGGTLYNTAVVIGPDGGIIGKYRKNSIPRILQTLKAGETPADEGFYFTPGDLGFPVFDTPFGVRIGILICYDRHFPEAARILGLQGAHLVLVPTATYREWIREVWEIELRGHAIANNYYVGGVNKVGPDVGGAPRRHYFGSSLFIGPRGQVLVRAGDQDDAVIYADIDPGEVERTRSLWGFFAARRPDIYRQYLGNEALPVTGRTVTLTERPYPSGGG
jgi:N-carbamoylputrescine amidase